MGQAAKKLYILATIYLVFSLFWWFLFRRLQSVYVLTLPYALYGLAFFILGLAPYAKTLIGRSWVQNLATGFYAAASSSGAFYFSLNFGSEGKCIRLPLLDIPYDSLQVAFQSPLGLFVLPRSKECNSSTLLFCGIGARNSPV